MPATPFTFFPPSQLVDDDLELIAPDAKWIDAVLRECSDPLIAKLDPQLAHTTRQSLLDFLHITPGGHMLGDPSRGQATAFYQFWMRWRDPVTNRFRMAGSIGVRIGTTPEIEMYSGHIGYHVYPQARGRHFAERASRLVLPVLKFHSMSPVWITCNPDNLPSRRTCERLGSRYIDTVDLPFTHPFFARGERQKCRYRWDI